MSIATLDRVGPVTVTHDTFEVLVAGLAPVLFPSLDDVESMAGRLLPVIGCRTGAGLIGQTYYLGISAGTVALRTRRVVGYELVGEDREDGADPLEVGLGAASVRVAGAAKGGAAQGELWEEVVPRIITEFSRDSRRRMVRTLAELDYSRWTADGGVLAMVTLTLPGWWEIVAPDGQAWKRLIEAFRLRWRHEVGRPWRCLWKMEFQRRGAPHQHMLMRVPSLVGQLTFEEWLSLTWAQVCRDSLGARDRAAYVGMGEYDRHLAAGTGVDFSAARFSDPRRTAIYFLKHSTKAGDGKEWQHTVPALWNAHGVSVGRFWGYAGLGPARAEIEIDYQGFIRTRRILRHVARARAAVTVINRARSLAEALAPTRGVCRCAEGVACEVRSWCRGAVGLMKRVRVCCGFGSSGGGWVLVNDGLRLAWDLGRALALP
jgi:hypothetical protein